MEKKPRITNDKAMSDAETQSSPKTGEAPEQLKELTFLHIHGLSLCKFSYCLDADDLRQYKEMRSALLNAIRPGGKSECTIFDLLTVCIWDIRNLKQLELYSQRNATDQQEFLRIQSKHAKLETNYHKMINSQLQFFAKLKPKNEIRTRHLELQKVVKLAIKRLISETRDFT